MSKKHMSPQEFNDFMKQRHAKIMKQNAGKTPFCVGAIIIPLDFEKIWPDKITQVECCRCGIPIYLSKWVYDEMQCYYVPWDETKHPYFCEFCLPPGIARGVRVQDIAAVLQHTEEK
jgi:hypothetical protein